MMPSDSPPSQWTRLPGKLTASILRLTDTDVTALGVLSVLGLILYRMYSTPGAFIALAITYLLMMQLEHVRRYDQLFFILPETLWFRLVRKGINWTPESRRSAVADQLKDLPGANVGLRFNVNNPDEVSVFITGSGSHIVNMSVDRMAAMHRQIADALGKISVKRGYTVTTGFILRFRPWDEYRQREFDQRSFDGNVLYPKLLADGEDAKNVTEDDYYHVGQNEYNEQVYDAFNQTSSTKPTMALTVTIRRKRTHPFKKNSSEAIYEDEVARQPIIQIATRAVAMLRNSTVQDATILNLEELQEYFREAWDNDTLDDYRRDIRQRTLSPHGHWPKEIIATTKSSVRTDKTHHGLIRITETAQAASPTHLVQIYGGPCTYRTVSMVTQSMRSKGDYFLTGVIIDIIDGIRNMVGNGRLRPAARAKAQERQEHEEISFTTKFRQLYDYWVVVPASSQHELEQEVRRTLEYYDSCNNITAEQVITHEPLLYRLTWRALTGVM